MNKSLGIDNKYIADIYGSSLLDESHLNQLRGNGQDDALQEIIEMFLKQTDEQINQLSETVSNNDTEATCNIAHQLKGSSANLGAIQLSEAFSQLEKSTKEEHTPSSDELLKAIRVIFNRTRIQFQSLLSD